MNVGIDEIGIVLERVVESVAVMHVNIDVGDAFHGILARSASITTPQSLNTQNPRRCHAARGGAPDRLERAVTLATHHPSQSLQPRAADVPDASYTPG